MLNLSVDPSSVLGSLAICLIPFFPIALFFLLSSRFISNFAIFEKAGKSSWANLIPFYRAYVLCDIALGIEWFGIVYCFKGLLLPLAASSLYSLALPGFNDSINFFSFTLNQAQVIACFVSLVMDIILNLNLAKRFSKGVGFAIGLIVLPVIFYPILAFDKSKYIPIGQEQNPEEQEKNQEQELGKNNNSEETQNQEIQQGQILDADNDKEENNNKGDDDKNKDKD